MSGLFVTLEELEERGPICVNCKKLYRPLPAVYLTVECFATNGRFSVPLSPLHIALPRYDLTDGHPYLRCGPTLCGQPSGMPMYFLAALDIMARVAFADALKAYFGERLICVEELAPDELETIVMKAVFANDRKMLLSWVRPML